MSTRTRSAFIFSIAAFLAILIAPGIAGSITDKDCDCFKKGGLCPEKAGCWVCWFCTAVGDKNRQCLEFSDVGVAFSQAELALAATALDN